MKIFLLGIVLLLRAGNLLADADDVAELREALKKVAPPTPEEILNVGLILKDQATAIITQSKNIKCDHGTSEEVEGQKIAKEEAPQCVICAMLSDNKTQLFAGQINPKSKYTPDYLTFKYTGLNDQPLHGLLEDFYKTGDDANGLTYGSEVSMKAHYHWGELTLELGSELYVSTYDVHFLGETYQLRTLEYNPRYFQEADEHSYARLRTKIFLGKEGDPSKVESSFRPYMKFGLGIEHDSDQGIGKGGAIDQRELWHKEFNKMGNLYLHHRESQSLIIGESKMGIDAFHPVGKFGLCSLVETGATVKSNGTMSLGAKVRASIDSGTFAGFSRKAPLVLLKVEAGIESPVVVGHEPQQVSDPNYPFLLGKNLPLIGDLKTSYTSVGIETGGSAFRFSLSVIDEKNKLNDGDLIYLVGLEVKY